METVVARCEVAGRPIVEPRCREAIRVRAGEILVVRFVYHVHERSREQDHWTFRLTVVQGGQARTDERRHDDHFMVTDQVVDAVSVELVFEEVGEVEIPFEALAQMRSTPWVDDTMRPKVQEDRARGVLRVRVE